MSGFDEYNKLCFELSEVITKRYTTSFSKGIKLLSKQYHEPIYAIYAFVRMGDEIVDSFHDHDKQSLLTKYIEQTKDAISNRISTNPVLQAFQFIYHKYDMEMRFVDAFFESMQMDLEKNTFDEKEYISYIYGSAEVVGLMCLKVFCKGNEGLFRDLEYTARKLGSALQKVNFLRDLKSDYHERDRIYFPGVDFDSFDESAKKKIESDIDFDFRESYPGIMNLPEDVRPGIYTVFTYYRALYNKIEKQSPEVIKQRRIRVPDPEKLILLARTYSKFGLKQG